MRISTREYYLNIAKAASQRSTCLRRKYGAVIVNKDEIISTGYNGSVRGGINCCDINDCPRLNMPHNSGDYSACRGVHAEQNAMLSASRQEMIGSELYLFGTDDNDNDIDDVEPCPICKKLIINAGIVKVITKSRVFDSVKDFL